MLQMPPLPPLPTHDEIKDYYVSDRSWNRSLRSAGEMLRARVMRQRKEIILQYTKDCRNVDELRLALVTWMENTP